MEGSTPPSLPWLSMGIKENRVHDATLANLEWRTTSLRNATRVRAKTSRLCSNAPSKILSLQF